MTGSNNNFNRVDPLESPAESRQSYRFHELAEELNTSVEQVETWIREADIKPMSDEEHASYHARAINRLRGLRRGGV